MGLREEFNEIPQWYAAEAVAGQLDSEDKENSNDSVELIEKYGRMLQDYPALQMLFTLISESSLKLEANSIEEKRALILGAGLALQGVKAIANKQIFDKLEAPSDLDG